MYAVIVNDEKDLLEFAKQKGFKVVRLDQNDTIEFSNSNSTKAKTFLLSLGIKPHLKGFKYLRYIFENEMDCEGGITKVIYPAVAEAFKTKASRVERAIRSAIETAAYDDPQVYQLFLNIFGSFDSKPTNQQFLEGSLLYLNEN